MKSSYTLKEKLDKLHEEGRFEEAMGEIRHYLGTLAKHTRSPLVVELLDMFKMTIDKDVGNIDKNLDVLDTLYNTPGLDVQVEVLGVFSRLASVPSMKQRLFDRYFAQVQTRFSTMSTRARSLIIECLDNVSRDMPAFQKQVIKFLFGHIDGVEPEVLLDILSLFSGVLADQVEAEAMFEAQCQHLLDRFAFEADEAVEAAFVNLFMYLPRCKGFIVETSLHWLHSRDYNLKHKALRLLPSVLETNMDNNCMASLLDGLKDKDPEFQSSVVDVLSSIMARNTRFHLSRVVKRFLNREEPAVEMPGFVELVVSLAGKDFEPTFSCIFDAMTVTDGLCDAASLAVFKSLNEEYPRQLDAAIFKAMESSSTMRAGTRLATFEKILAITIGLKSEIVSVWFAKYLFKLASEEEGDEIQRKASSMIDRIRAVETDLEGKIGTVNDRIKGIEDSISTMKNYPRLLRERTPIFTEVEEPGGAARMLDVEYRSMLQKIIDFDNAINKLEFKHLIMDHVEEWYQAKDYILDDLNTVKEYILGQIDAMLKRTRDDMAAAIRKLAGKKEVVLAEFEELRASLHRIPAMAGEEIGAITGRIAQVTTSLLLFDLEASKMLIEQPVSLGGYQSFLESWSTARAQMERELDGGIATIDRWIEKSTAERENDPDSKERAMVMYKFFSSFIRASIQDFRTILDEFQSKDEEITAEFSTCKFEDIEKGINFKKSKLLELIENKAYLIEKYWRGLNQASHDIEFIVNVGRLKEEWLTTRDNIVEKIQHHYHAQLERVDAEKIKQMLHVVNPIPIGSLKGKLRSIPQDDDVRYIAGVIDIVQKHQINALVQNNMLFNPRDPASSDVPGAPVRVRAGASPRAEMVVLKITVENTSISEVYDVAVSLKLPPFMRLHEPNLSEHRQGVASVESGKNCIFTWVLEDMDGKDASSGCPSVQASKITVVVSGKLPGERHFSKTEDLCFIYKTKTI